MAYWNRIRNALFPSRVEREIAEEVGTHIEEAGGARLFGGELRYREASRDIKVAQWLDSLRADVVFGWRQLAKRKTATLAAVLSLAIGTGAVLSAFRLLDAGFLRELPVAGAGHLYFLRYTMLNIDGARADRDSFSYDEFLAMREAMNGEARLFMVSFADRQDITFGGVEETEKVTRQYISGAAFEDFRLTASTGRLFGREQDTAEADHRIAVLTHDYAVRRFGGAAQARGKTFRYLGEVYPVVGVIEPKFTGTATGAVIDVFLPLLANQPTTTGMGKAQARNARILVHLDPGVAPHSAVEKLRAAFRRERESFVKDSAIHRPEVFRDAYLGAQLRLLPAAGGISNFQRDFRVPITILCMMAVLLLALCCANGGNLITIQSAGRARELALRTAIGAGRRRLARMLLVESLMLGAAGATLGLLFAWWSAPLVTARLNPPDNPVRLPLEMDARVAAAGIVLAFAVTLLFGLLPALRAPVRVRRRHSRKARARSRGADQEGSRSRCRWRSAWPSVSAPDCLGARCAGWTGKSSGSGPSGSCYWRLSPRSRTCSRAPGGNWRAALRNCRASRRLG